MFGHNNKDQSVMGQPTVQNPSMLDNVTQQDFQVSSSQPTTQMQDDGNAADSAMSYTQTPIASQPQQAAITTDNPFIGEQSAALASDPVSSSSGADMPGVTGASDDANTTASTDSVSESAASAIDAATARLEQETTHVQSNDPASVQPASSEEDQASSAVSDIASASPSGPVAPPPQPQPAAVESSSESSVLEETQQISRTEEEEPTEEVSDEADSSPKTEELPTGEPKDDEHEVAPEPQPVAEERNEEYLESLTSDEKKEDLVTSMPVDKEKLASMKKKALEHLEPLTEHLDGTPEETFKTTMMMIQANDNHTLLEKALKAAQDIEDDKVRAQAMLDIINEINYFSQSDTVDQAES